MIELSRRPPGLHIKQIFFADRPFDVDGCDAVQFPHCKTDVDLKGFKQTPQNTIVVDLSVGKDKLWANLNKNYRTEIRSALRSGIVIRRNEDYDAFLVLNNEFRARKGIKPSTLPLDFMKKNCVLVTAQSNGEIVSGLLFVVDGNDMLGLLGASKRLEADHDRSQWIAKINKLLFWEIFKCGLESGARYADLGGYGQEINPSSGIDSFKSGFGGQVVHLFNYEKEYTLKVKLGRVAMRTLGHWGQYFYTKGW